MSVIFAIRRGFFFGRVEMRGEQDGMVPVSHGKWLASKIPNVETRFLADDGHPTFSAGRNPAVHAWLTGKMHV
jgi:hypothetical protein